ncbi:MAG: TauD/TfdA family dioxygenase [Gammaproteobacteria bacterium]|nr:TauD/TfdA family dioxygenase [Gammaproteobacteria bacterium]
MSADIGGDNAVTITPLSGAIGAEVGGIENVADMSEREFAQVRDALMGHAVLVFRDQRLTPDQQKDFSRRFGALMPVPFVKTLDEHPEIIGVIKEADERTHSVFGGGWHSDFSFLERPPLASCLYALDVPAVGGDTLFASTRGALEGLSDGLRAMLDGLKVLHSGKRSYGTRGRFSRDQLASMPVEPSAEGDVEVPHPLIRTLPESGAKCLFVNPAYTVRVDGWSEEESAPLLKHLYARIARPENTCRVSWSVGTLVIWDNRAALHAAVNDYDGFRREMHRTTISGERPI